MVLSSRRRARTSASDVKRALVCFTVPLVMLVAGGVCQPAWAQSSISNEHFWLHDVMGHLARNARHPDQLRPCPSRGGKVMLQFEIDRSGRLLKASVKESSGIADLDHAALEMLKRASPLPPPP